METIIENRNGQTFISVTGRLDTVSAVEFQNQLDELHDTDVTHVVIDCAALEYISSSGLRAFISLLKRANTNGGNVNVAIWAVW